MPTSFPPNSATRQSVPPAGGSTRKAAPSAPAPSPDRIAVMAFVIFQQEGELGLVAVFCVPDLHGGSV